MDPTTVFCPNENCPARGHIGKGNIGIHSRKEQRFICHACDKTFSATKGTVNFLECWEWDKDKVQHFSWVGSQW